MTGRTGTDRPNSLNSWTSWRFGFAALVVVGDGKGTAGFGTGKAREVPEAIRKATERAKRDKKTVPLRDRRTLFHDVHGRYGAGRVLLRSARLIEPAQHDQGHLRCA